MNNQEKIKGIIKSVSGQANTLTIPRLYLELTDRDIKAALLLSQCVYWSDKSTRKDGFFYKSADDWYEEICLSRSELDRARKVLEERGFLKTEVHRANGTPTLHWRAEIDAITEAIYTKGANPDLQETDKSECRKPTNQYVEKPQILNRDYTETTTDIIPPTAAKPAEHPTVTARKESTKAALQRGQMRRSEVIGTLQAVFSVQPDTKYKDWRDLIDWFMQMEKPGEQIEAFARWWYANDWRGKTRQPPTPKNIYELWPQASKQTHTTGAPEGYTAV